MAYEEIRTSFRTDLHARWSAFFDAMDVPWTYEPCTFRAADGGVFTPAFWLPRERMWFDAEADESMRPPRWQAFAAAAAQRAGRPAARDAAADGRATAEEAWQAPVDVPPLWRGRALLALGWLPDYHAADAQQGPWGNHHAYGMYTHNDTSYQWTLCPACGTFGAELLGLADRLPCPCPDDRRRVQQTNAADTRLVSAYRQACRADVAPLDDPAFLGAGDTLRPRVLSRSGHRVLRRALARRSAAEAPAVPGALGLSGASGVCTGHCRTAADRAVTVAEAADGDGAGTVVRGASAPVCRARGCAPTPLLTLRRGREHLHDLAVAVAQRDGSMPAHTAAALDREMGVTAGGRSRASLGQLAVGLTAAERWLAEAPIADAPAAVDEGDAVRLLPVGHLRGLVAVGTRATDARRAVHGVPVVAAAPAPVPAAAVAVAVAAAGAGGGGGGSSDGGETARLRGTLQRLKERRPPLPVGIRVRQEGGEPMRTRGH